MSPKMSSQAGLSRLGAQIAPIVIVCAIVFALPLILNNCNFAKSDPAMLIDGRPARCDPNQDSDERKQRGERHYRGESY